MAEMTYAPITQYQLYMCCTLFLHADNSMPSAVDPGQYSQWLDNTAQALGFTSWLDFYHGYPTAQPQPGAPIDGVTQPPEIIE